MADCGKYVMVAGVDFGTTYSGYAFSFTGSESDIKINKNWGSSQGFTSYKAPTCVLLNESDEFEAFGYDAEESYIESQANESSEGRKKLFKDFKMMLYTNKDLSIASTITSVCQNKAPAIEIFAHALRFMKDHLVTELSKQLPDSIDPTMIRWVITVPAIWSDEAKFFMREAAFKAGYIPDRNSKQLVIALEPEAASFYCRQLNLAHFAENKDISFPSGTKYLVLDCGGGTNDMVVHQVVVDYKVKELQAVNGGKLGGNVVTEAFVTLLKEILGPDFISDFINECPQQWFELMMHFERAKKLANDDGDCRMKVIVPFEIAQRCTDTLGITLKRAFNLPERGIRFVAGSIILNHSAIRTLFKPVVSAIVDDVKNVLDATITSDLTYILMVGGFSESTFLQKAIKEQFENESCNVLIPQETQLAVIKGAVLYGHHQDQVITRIARKTYGLGVSNGFIDGLHDPKRRFIDSDGDVMCRGCFDTILEFGKEVKLGHCIEREYVMAKGTQVTRLSLLSSQNKGKTPIQYDDDDGITELATIVLKTPKQHTLKQRYIAVQFTFGSTELYVEAIDKTSGNKDSIAVEIAAKE